MKTLNNQEFIRTIIPNYVNKNSTVIDATLGNGNDTLFLSPLVNEVIAFEIQSSAIFNTEKLLKENKCFNIKIINDSHEYILKYYKHYIDFAIFNLGYLPGGDKEITTKPESTIKAIKGALALLHRGGAIVVTVYPGHPTGEIESIDVGNLLKKLDPNEYEVLKYQSYNKNNAPYVFLIEKK